MIARAVLFAALIACAACGGDESTGPSDPPADLTGTWTGQIGSSASGTAVRFTWTATQAGNNASGPVTLVKPAIGTELPGTLSAAINGNQVGLSLSAPAGGVPTVPGCSASGTGAGTAGTNSLAGTFNLTATGCSSIGIENAPSAALLMTR